MTTPTTREELIAQITDAIREVQFLYTPSDPVKLATSILDRVPILDAALDMLVALKAMCLQVEYLHEKFQETGSGNAELAKARAAIKKARGP